MKKLISKPQIEEKNNKKEVTHHAKKLCHYNPFTATNNNTFLFYFIFFKPSKNTHACPLKSVATKPQKIIFKVMDHITEMG